MSSNSQPQTGRGQSGPPDVESWLERLLFRFRPLILLTITGITLFFIIQVYDLEMDSNLKKMVPLQHPYIQNFFKHKDDLRLGNELRIAVENTDGDIFDPDFLSTLRQISDEAFYLPGVDKSRLKSLWTPNVRWSQVDTEGIRGGEIIPPTYDGSPEAVEQVRQNVLKSDLMGVLVSDDMKSTIIHLPLIDVTTDDSNNTNKIDYRLLAEQIETSIRGRFENDTVRIHIIGFAKKVGDLIEAINGVVLFFISMLIITFHLLIYDNRCVRSSSVIMVGAVMAVVWQLGIVTLLRKGMVNLRQTEWWARLVEINPTLESIQFGMDPYSMLVPFLVFAIAVSHGVQYVNDMTARMASGDDAILASRSTFRALFMPGLLALVSDAIGFITLWFIDIGVIRELAITASVGVAVIVLTKLIFVPVVLSYVGVGEKGLERSLSKRNDTGWQRLLANLLNPKAATASILIGVILAGVGLYLRQDLKIGDLNSGAPEFHRDSRYNQDNQFITDNFSVSADVLVVMVETEPGLCSTFPILSRIDRFMNYMNDVEGVESTASLVSVAKHIMVGFNEGNFKWSRLPKEPATLNGAMIYLPDGFTNVDCSLVPVYIFLHDHKADTLERAVSAVENYPDITEDTAYVRYVLASGSAGVEAATNQTIKQAEYLILMMVYGVVCLMVLQAFRSWRAMICIILPLMLTSILCEALMTLLHIGVKVATLPVIALGVGIGVDYGIYIYAKIQRCLDQGLDLRAAYLETLTSTGRSVVFTCVALSLSVGFWIFSHIKFQSDMGILLTFMFLWNMVGAIWLLPALAYFILPNHVVRGAGGGA